MTTDTLISLLANGAGDNPALGAPGRRWLSYGDLHNHGKVVIRGPNVTAGHENNPKANAGALTHGWFCPGDQGVIDDPVYVRLTGRQKEIINRGGEKTSGREVDDVPMDHPAVAQVVTFAVPHDKLGEDVAAAVVLCDGHKADEATPHVFARERLADFEVPRTSIRQDVDKGRPMEIDALVTVFRNWGRLPVLRPHRST